MCGVLGYLSSNSLDIKFKDDFRRALNYLQYRGPDNLQAQYYELANQYLAFGHTRLSIIDLQKISNQPLVSLSGKTILSFNGEIYNYKAIQAELISKGIKFKTNSDSEVIVNAFEYWGVEQMLAKLDGMFAFGIYDFERKKLIIARDRFGKKPLYYYKSENHFAFSSDIRSVKKLIPFTPSINMHGLGYYFAELTTPREESIWSAIKKLRPGFYAEVEIIKDKPVFTEKQYWNLNFTASCHLGFNEIIENTEQLLNQAVKKRLVADVRVAALLSGGIDSSLVVAKMAENSSERINTYSMTTSIDTYDESKYSDIVAKRFNTNHTKLNIEPSSLKDIKSLIDEYGEPFADSSMIPSYLISKAVSNTEKVVLGGDGGDEFFGGYDSYYKAFKYEKVKHFSSLQFFTETLSKAKPSSYRLRLLNDLLKKTKEPEYKFLNRSMGFSSEELKILLDNENGFLALDSEHEKIYNDKNTNVKSPLIRLMNSSLHTRLLNDYLVKVDRATMYASIEMRSPFLDKDLAEFAAQLQPKQIYYNGEPKSILKKILSKYFSSEFVNRKKMGFSIPMDNWFRSELNNELREVVLQENPLIKLNRDYILQLLREHESEQSNHDHKLWALYVFNIWASMQ